MPFPKDIIFHRIMIIKAGSKKNAMNSTRKNITLIFLPQILQDFGQVALTFLFFINDLIFLTHFFAPATFHFFEHRF